MKRRQRRPVLTIDKPQSTYHIEHMQGRHKPANNVQPAQNEAENPLANLLCQYNSDSDTEDSKKDVQKLDDQVNDFFKEIQLIAPERPTCNVAKDPTLAVKTNPQSTHHISQQTLWQECYDKSSGYPYYWHIETDEVTWDMPEELRLIKKQSEMESTIKPSVQSPHWVDFSSIAYRQSQANIPEGMIPQEVVARNRNRFIHKETTKKCTLENKVETRNESPAKDDDSDDGRIEMITSFGSDGSDSEDDNNSSDEKKASILLSESGNSNSALYPKNNEIGPTFCPTGMQSTTRNLSRPYKPDSTKAVNISNSTDLPELSDESRITESDSNNSTLQTEKELSMENKSRKDINKFNAVPKLDINVSLVPGYGDDSDVEEEMKPKQEIKPLFPIAQDDNYVSTTNALKDTAFTKSSSNVQVSDQSNNGNIDARETKSDHEKTEEKELKIDEDKSKTNIFLEDMQICGKAFQRKKRIAFDVTSNKIKQNNIYHDNAIQDNNNDLTNNGTTSRNDDGDAEMHSQSCIEGPKECEETREQTEQCISVKPEEKLSSKEESCDSEVPVEHKTASNPVEERTNDEMNDLSQIITEKLKFLSEGRESVSAVQTMQIQLQTLSTAWSAGSLEENYFQKWLTSTNHELERLEQDAAPAGWLCQWDRSHKRYFYHNTSTGTSQWTYPDTGIAGGTEEMELCTTPPPPESEELSVTGSPGTKKPKEKQTEEMDDNKVNDENVTEGRPAELEVPPSSQISNPSTPPPSRIFEEDLKKDKRKKEKSDDKPLDVKRKRFGKERITAVDTAQSVNPTLESLSYAHPQAAVSPQTSIPANHANMEPLPPGVDLPDTSYEAATLKGIIYNATSQQSNAIYAPSIADPTIPILSHQPGLLQEPFVHYPAFHQHLHNTAAIAVANKHSGQSAIQFMLGYTPIYSNNKIIAKPPVKAAKESLGSALDSFYNDIARIERTETERAAQHQDTIVMEQVSAPAAEEAKLPEVEPESVPCDTMTKEKKKKKSRISISKKHKEMSTMVAKWQRVQKNLEENV
ncbi:formin-binding protein 4-like isoform X3 [Odontomachus brunneus]|uniref:formin-binding protein 4-like isoform X3 n=1 Tax=Odontomachus brunneus TaxID=486640 RepID=UPI0013F1F55C|nr:formin-binding protein 4-like isoform X3 [Odontomachus brunneus]